MMNKITLFTIVVCFLECSQAVTGDEFFYAGVNWETIRGTWQPGDDGWLYADGLNTGFFTYVVAQTEVPTDYQVTATTKQLEGYGSTGILIRYQDQYHYYEIVLDWYAEDTGALPPRSLAIYKCSSEADQEGPLMTTWQPDPDLSPQPFLYLLAGKHYDISDELPRTYQLTAKVEGNTISMYVDGNLELSVIDTDSPHTAGRFGLYSYWTDAAFSIDLTPPTLAPVATPATLWPPNRKMVDVYIDSHATDNSGRDVTLCVDQITCVHPSEKDKLEHTAPDWQVVGIDQEIGVIHLQLRSEQVGRTYTIVILGTDPSGNVATAYVEVPVTQ